VVKLYEIANTDFKGHSDSCATDFPLIIIHAYKGGIEDMRIKGGKSKREWTMVARKGSRKVFGPKQPDQHSEQILERHLFHDILLTAVSFPRMRYVSYGNSSRCLRPPAQTRRN
jgi:hypothetical protein